MLSQSELRQEISQQIYDTLKSGKVLPWRRSWQVDPCAGLPTNALTGIEYTGENTILLEVSSLAEGYQSKYWATRSQFKSLGTNVRQGEKGTNINFFWPSDPWPKDYFVWNVEQTDGGNHLRAGNSNAHPPIKTDAKAEYLMAATKADIQFGGNRAYWSNVTDHVQLPSRSQFFCKKEFYLAVMHELSHWTGARKRLARNDLCFWREEIVAEISAAYTCCELGVTGKGDLPNVVSYIKYFLNEDPSFIFEASSDASKAADFLLRFRQRQQPTVF